MERAKQIPGYGDDSEIMGDHDIVLVSQGEVYRDLSSQLMVAFILTLACEQRIKVELPIRTDMVMSDKDIKRLKFAPSDYPYVAGDHIEIVRDPDGSKRVNVCHPRKGGSKKS